MNTISGSHLGNEEFSVNKDSPGFALRRDRCGRARVAGEVRNGQELIGGAAEQLRLRLPLAHSACSAGLLAHCAVP